MIGAGTILNPILKVVTTVAILGAVYLFIVKPTLDTTESIIDKTGAQIENAQADSAKAFSDSQVRIAKGGTDGYVSSLQNNWPQAAREVKACVRAAGREIRALERCKGIAKDLVHAVQSDRSFALSYANSLASQGRGSDASRVRGCVKGAGFKVGAMQRCRDLADRLLFG